MLKPIINITSFEGWQSGRWRFFRVKECMESYADTNLVLVAVIALPVELKACNVNVRLSKFFASMETVQNVILCSVCNLKMIIEQSCLHWNWNDLRPPGLLYTKWRVWNYKCDEEEKQNRARKVFGQRGVPGHRASSAESHSSPLLHSSPALIEPLLVSHRIG